MISPVLDEGAVTVRAYIPDARVYNYFTGAEETANRKAFLEIPTALDVINLHLLGGNIIPTQEHALNTEAARKNPLGLIVALDDADKAEGQLYYDAGDSAGM
jgi:alpha-glucosidase (family GH31 glycosyl hydrolase)